MARITHGVVAVLSFILLSRWFDMDPAGFLVLGMALLAAGPFARFVIRSVGKTEIRLPAGPSRFTTMTTASSLSVVKAALAEGILPRRTDRLTDRS